MPPKLTKEQKERLKREEEERRRLEEEEQRRLEEEERRQREEQERLEQEEQARLKAIEEARFTKESGELSELISSQQEALEEWREETKKKEEWESFLNCDHLPRPENEATVNTFLSSWEEEEDWSNIDTLMEGLREAEQFREKVLVYLDSGRKPDLSKDMRKSLLQALERLNQVAADKVHKCTMEVFKCVDDYIEAESGNVLVERGTPGYSLCLWGNLSKNPRVKSFTFKEREVTVEIPKPLLLADIIVRLQITQNDRYTPLSRTGKSVSRPPSKTTALPDGVGEEGDPPTVGGGAEGEQEELATAADNEKSETVGSKVCSAVAVDAVDNKEEEEKREGQENGGKEEGEGAPDDSPQGLVDVSSAALGLKDDDDDPLLDEGEVDMRSMMVAGGVMEFELLRLPPQSKTVGPWTFQQVLEGGISVFPYPPDVRGASNIAGGQQGGGAGEGQPPQTPGNVAGPPVNITAKLPNDFLFHSEPKVARWDPLHQYWTTNSVLGVDVNMDECTFSCQVPSFSPLVLLTDSHWNMPYRSWQLSPSGPDSTLLTIDGAHQQVKVEIKEDKCRLLPQPKPVPAEGVEGEEEGEEPLLNKMADKWLTTRDLMKTLLTFGVNIFPSNDSHKYVDLPDKSRTVEDQLCVHLAMLSGVFAFSWSKWSSSPTLGRRQFVMRAAEWGEEGGAGAGQEPPWFLMVGGDRSYKLALKEKDEEFSDELREDCEAHPDVYSCVVKTCPQVTKERLSTMTSPVHVDNVTHWLQATRVLSFS